MEKLGGASAPALPLLLFFGLFVVVGAGMWINIVWGLITGGPRDRTKTGQPYLHDRPYYLFFLIMITGWTMGLLSFDQAAPDVASGFLVGWGICAIGMGLIFQLRRDMMLDGAKYLSQHGFILFRPFHAMRVMQFNRQSMVWKIVPVVFLVTGIGVLAFNLPHLGQAMTQARDGALTLINFGRAMLRLKPA